MLEQPSGLLALQIHHFPSRPATGQTTHLPAQRLPDHRRLYLDYEGAVSGNRGHVSRLARGTYRLEQLPGRSRQRLLLHSDTLTAELEIPSLQDCPPGSGLKILVQTWQFEKNEP